MSGHVVSPKVYMAVFGTLMVLTFTTVWAARHDFGEMNTVVALVIAVTKASLVVLFFMHVKYGSRLVWLVVCSAFVWLALLLVITMHDYYSPSISPGKVPSI